MIGLTQALFSYTSAKLLGLNEKFAVLGGLIPSVSMVLIYAGPLKYEGILLSFTSVIFFSTIIFYSSGPEAGKGLFTGYSCSLLLESFTFSYLPVFYPFTGFQGLGLFSSFDPVWNLSIISACLLVLAGIKLKN